MRACYNCQQVYPYGEICPICGDYLYEYEQGQPQSSYHGQSQQYAQGYSLSPQVSGQFAPQRPAAYSQQYDSVPYGMQSQQMASPQLMAQMQFAQKKSGSSKIKLIIIIALSVLLAAAIGVIVYLWLNPTVLPASTSESTKEQVEHPTAVEQAVVDSAHTYLMKAYGVYQTYFSAGGPNAASASTNATSQLDGSVNDSLSAVTALAAFADNDYYESINKPMLALDAFPALVDIWKQVPALSTSNTNTNAEEAKARLVSIIEEFQLTASSEGFDTSKWKGL